MMAEAAPSPRSSACGFHHDRQADRGAEAVGEHKTSMLQDVEHGRALELDALLGSVIELARLTGTPTPHCDAVYACVSLLGSTLAAQKARLQVQPQG